MGKNKEFNLKQWMKKHWSNVLFAVFLILMLFPTTRTPIQVAINRIFSFPPSVMEEDKQEKLTDYNWQLIEIDGNEVNLKEAEGKVILINVWATWCPPCIAEMPSLQALYDDYKEEVNFYFIANDNPDAVKRFMQKNNYTFPVTVQASNAPDLLKSNSLPTTFLIDQEANLLVNKTGAANWNSSSFRNQLDKLLN